MSEGQTILIIEAMKTMNQIAAPCAAGSRILVEDGQPVEYGAPLMILMTPPRAPHDPHQTRRCSPRS